MEETQESGIGTPATAEQIAAFEAFKAFHESGAAAENSLGVQVAATITQADETGPFVMPTQADLDAALAHEASLHQVAEVELAPAVLGDVDHVQSASDLTLEPATEFVPLPGHEIQHTAHLTDGPPW